MDVPASKLVTTVISGPQTCHVLPLRLTAGLRPNPEIVGMFPDIAPGGPYLCPLALTRHQHTKGVASAHPTMSHVHIWRVDLQLSTMTKAQEPL